MFFSLDHLRQFGDRLCLSTSGGAQTSYAELTLSARNFASRLPPRRMLVAIEAEASPRAIVAYVGALAAGHAVMPLPVDDTETARLLEQRFRPAASYRMTDGRWRLLFHDHPPAALHPDLALLLQTSGSTGHGRGVRLSATALHANAASIAEYLSIGSQDRAALILPLHYSYGLSVLHSHLLRGASLWLAPASVLDPAFADGLAASGATSLAGVPHHFRMIEGAGLADRLAANLQLLTCAGGAMEPSRVLGWANRMARHKGRFVVMYGQTEATARIAWLPPDRVAANPDAIGLAIPGGELSLRNPSGPTAEGELVYRGPNVMMGYAADHSDLSRGTEVTELATGDLARRDADGLFRITGRLSRMSKIAGLRIGHDALERALAERGHETVVWGDDRGICIAVRGPMDGIARHAAQLAGIGQQHFTTITCDSFPRRPNGKIDYPALKAVAVQAKARTDVLAAFSAAFAPRHVDPKDSFESLGGDSLCHAELSLALDDRLGGASEGWERMRIEELERAQPNPTPAIPTEMLARALAILAVVVSHQTLWPIYGGAAAMVILMGMSVAGFRWQALEQGDMRRFLYPMVAVLLPYYAIVAGYALAWHQMPWASVFLVGNFALTTPETRLMLPYLYWFIEAYVQITLLVAALFLFAPMRRWLVARGRFFVGLALLALAVMARVIVAEFWPTALRVQFTLPWILWLFALGWCAATAETRRQKLVLLGVAFVLMPWSAYVGGNWLGSWVKYLSLLALFSALLFLPKVRMPRLAIRPVTRLAQAAFPIYLLHRFVPENLMPLVWRDGSGGWFDLIAITGGIGIGLAAAALQRQIGKDWITLPVRRFQTGAGA